MKKILVGLLLGTMLFAESNVTKVENNSTVIKNIQTSVEGGYSSTVTPLGTVRLTMVRADSEFKVYDFTNSIIGVYDYGEIGTTEFEEYLVNHTLTSPSFNAYGVSVSAYHSYSEVYTSTFDFGTKQQDLGINLYPTILKGAIQLYASTGYDHENKVNVFKRGIKGGYKYGMNYIKFRHGFTTFGDIREETDTIIRAEFGIDKHNAITVLWRLWDIGILEHEKTVVGYKFIF